MVGKENYNNQKLPYHELVIVREEHNRKRINSKERMGDRLLESWGIQREGDL